ncbi:MAG TPA: redoxin domain-containing protein [Pyrinomonadaceae bacterium]|nr:redoxin domain-containing protein [Pyrinomonadaceae bacterium]
MFKRTLILTVIIVLVASVAVVRIARLRGRGPHSTASKRATATNANVAVAVSDLQPDELIAAANAPAAPEFAKGTWINSEPLTVERLRGHVVLVEFWTFGCYNCRNTLPSVRDWDARYRERGLTIVGVHTPETTSEYSIDNVRREVPDLGIKYPVVTDNDYITWKAYAVEAWPTILVVDKQGRIRWLHVGEGKYTETESVIKTLLAE